MFSDFDLAPPRVSFAPHRRHAAARSEPQPEVSAKSLSGLEGLAGGGRETEARSGRCYSLDQ